MPGDKSRTSSRKEPKREKSVTDLPSSSSSDDDLVRSNRKRGSATDDDDDGDGQPGTPALAKRRKTEVKPTPKSASKKKLEDEVSEPEVFTTSATMRAITPRAGGYSRKPLRTSNTYKGRRETSKTKQKEIRKSKSPGSDAVAGFQRPSSRIISKISPAVDFDAPSKPKLKSDPTRGFDKPPTVSKPDPTQGFDLPRKAKRSTGVQIPGGEGHSGSSTPPKAPSKSSSNLHRSAEAALVMKGLGMKALKPAINGQSSSTVTSTLPGAQTSSECSSPLSSIYSSDFDEDVSTSMDPLLLSTPDEMLPTKKCQVCRAKVLSSIYRAFLEVLPEHKRGSKLNARQQVNFCRYHKKHTARIEWKRRKYPEIEWNGLSTRVQGLKSDVEAIINGSEKSHFSQRLLGAHQGKGGRRKKVLAEFDGDLGAEKAGYYGGQGAKIIGEEIATLCNSTFKNNSGHEVVQAAGGIGAYIQMVIVPEVASRLVAEDMECDLFAARDILVQSAELGRQLCEELDDEIHEQEEEQEEDDDEVEVEDD